MNIQDCINQGYLLNIKPDENLIRKEINESEYDLDKAENSLNEKDWKWTTIASYYSMFHLARAVLFKLGLREKKHFAIVLVLEELNKQGKLEMKYINQFEAAMTSREDADYHYTYSQTTAEHSLKTAKEFIQRLKKLL